MKEINQMNNTELEKLVIELYKTVTTTNDVRDVEFARGILFEYEKRINDLQNKINQEIVEQEKKIKGTSELLKKQKSLKNALLRNQDELELKKALVKSTRAGRDDLNM